MNTTKHMPGPWKAERRKTWPEDKPFHTIIDDQYQTLATTNPVDKDDREAMEADAADARLMASAPDLLAACKRAAAALREGLNTGTWAAADGLCRALTAAIEKAERAS